MEVKNEYAYITTERIFKKNSIYIFFYSYVMGQKVHPIGARLGITQTFQSNWYAKDTRYSFFLKEESLVIINSCRTPVLS